MEEGAFFAAVFREVLENFVEFCLLVLVDVEQEPAEFVLKVVHASKVIVAALFVGLEESFAQVAAFESFVDGLGAESASSHCRCNAASGEGVRVVGCVADEGEVVERVVFQNARNGDDSTDNVVDSCSREELVEPFHRDIENVPVVLACNQESSAEVRDVGFLFGEAPDVAVVDKVVTLPEREIVGAGEDALHLNVDACACESRLLQAVESELSSDAAFDAIGCDDHLGSDFFGGVAFAFAEFYADEAHAFFDISDKFCTGACDELCSVVFGEVGEPRVELFAVEHDARAFLREVDVYAVRAVNIKSVDNAFDATVVDRAVSLQVCKLGACFAAAHGNAYLFALFE